MRRMTMAAIVVIALACAGCSIIKATPSPTTPTGTLQGVVTGPGGPVVNAEVLVTASDATQHTGATNHDGYYSIGSIPAGPASYSVQAAGFAQLNGSLVIMADPTGNRQDVSLNPQ